MRPGGPRHPGKEDRGVMDSFMFFVCAISALQRWRVCRSCCRPCLCPGAGQQKGQALCIDEKSSTRNGRRRRQSAADTTCRCCFKKSRSKPQGAYRRGGESICKQKTKQKTARVGKEAGPIQTQNRRIKRKAARSRNEIKLFFGAEGGICLYFFSFAGDVKRNKGIHQCAHWLMHMPPACADMIQIPPTWQKKRLPVG